MVSNWWMGLLADQVITEGGGICPARIRTGMKSSNWHLSFQSRRQVGSSVSTTLFSGKGEVHMKFREIILILTFPTSNSGDRE